MLEQSLRTQALQIAQQQFRDNSQIYSLKELVNLANEIYNYITAPL